LRLKFIFLLILILCLLMSLSCEKAQKAEVIIYTSVDENYSKVILEEFEKKTEIKVKAVFDVEATKSAGLANRLMAERNNPQADVFWSGEPMHIIILKGKGVLEKYKSPSASDIPGQFKDPEYFWTGFSGRVRVIIYNKNLVRTEDVPSSIFDFTEEKYRGKFAVANPLFGTTTFHFISLFNVLGEEEAVNYFKKLKANEARVVDGNSVVRKLVELGEIEMGLTDSDDAELSLLSGKNVGIVYPDKDSIGTLPMPNMVALIKGGSNPDNGKKFIDYLLSREVEEKLISIKWSKFSIRDVSTDKPIDKMGKKIKLMPVDLEKIASIKEKALKKIRSIFQL